MRRRDVLVGSAGAGSLALGGCVGPGGGSLIVPATAAESQAIEDRWRAVEAVKVAAGSFVGAIFLTAGACTSSAGSSCSSSARS